MSRVFVINARNRRAAINAYEEIRDVIPRHRFIKSPTFRRAIDAANQALKWLTKDPGH
jgi:hypothetical protein